MNRYISAIALAGAIAWFSAPASATVVVPGSGWQDDTTSALGIPSDMSPFTFTITENHLFSLTDAYGSGDIYTVEVNGGPNYASSFMLFPTPFNNDLGPFALDYAPAWLDLNYSHLQIQFAPGSYSLVITGDCGAGCPAGFGYRLDPGGAPNVPEPASLALILGAFGLAGAGRLLRKKH